MTKFEDIQSGVMSAGAAIGALSKLNSPVSRFAEKAIRFNEKAIFFNTDNERFRIEMNMLSSKLNSPNVFNVTSYKPHGKTTKGWKYRNKR